MSHHGGLLSKLPSQQLAVQWTYGFKKQARSAFSHAESKAIEEHFRRMREEKAISAVFETADWRFDLLNMKATSISSFAGGVYDMMRVLPDALFVPYELPKGHSYNYLDNNELQGKGEDDLVALWLRWDGSDQAYKEYEKSLWSAYSPEDNIKLEKLYRNWVKAPTDRDGTTSAQPIDEAYSVNFTKMVQFRTQNSYRRRHIKRVLFGWFWKANGDTWVPFNYTDSLRIERSRINKEPEILLDLGENQYKLNLLEMCQYNTKSPLKRRPLLRIGPPFSSQDVMLDGTTSNTKLLLNVDRSFPSYWELPCKEACLVTIDCKNTKLGKQLSNLINNTVFPYGHEGKKFGLDPVTGKEPKSFRITRIQLVQNPTLWSNYMYKKGKLVISQFGEHKPLLDNPLAMPCLDKAAGEYYLWHGNFANSITAMTEESGLQYNFRSSIMSGCGGLFFSEFSSQANLYVPCPTCGLGAMTLPVDQADACTCRKGRHHTYNMLLCRVLIGRPYPYEQFEHGMQVGRKVLDNYNSVLCKPKDDRSPREVLMHDHSYVYPEFVVTYERNAESWDLPVKTAKVYQGPQYDNSLPVDDAASTAEPTPTPAPAPAPAPLALSKKKGKDKGKNSVSVQSLDSILDAESQSFFEEKKESQQPYVTTTTTTSKSRRPTSDKQPRREKSSPRKSNKVAPLEVPGHEMGDSALSSRVHQEKEKRSSPRHNHHTNLNDSPEKKHKHRRHSEKKPKHQHSEDEGDAEKPGKEYVVEYC